MVGTLVSPAEAAHLKPMLHVECCTNHPVSSTRVVSRSLLEQRFIFWGQISSNYAVT